MKRVWIKKENIYHKPFYKQKLKMTLLLVIVMGIFFFAHQVLYMNQLQLSTLPNNIISSTRPQSDSINRAKIIIVADKAPHVRNETIRGIRFEDTASYQPPDSNKFRCLRTGQLIPFKRVNDDYCDCPDGTDEPSTNACPIGEFFCTHRIRHPRATHLQQTSIPNSRINDGICDCCDGSDEWLAKPPLQCPMRCS